MTITRDQFISAGKYKSFDVDSVGQVRIKALPVKERFNVIGKQVAISGDESLDTIGKTKAITDVQIYMIALSLVDDNGNRIFDANSEEDLAVIADKDDEILGVIIDEIVTFNKFSSKNKEVSPVDETAKN